MADAPSVLIKRAADGRHIVMSPDGQHVYGLHNSLQSATRQVADYFKPDLAEGQAKPAAPSGPPTNDDLTAGMQYGAGLSQAHPGASPAQLIDFAHQQQQAQQAKMQLQLHQQQMVHPGAYQNPLAQAVAQHQHEMAQQPTPGNAMTGWMNR